MMQNKTWNQWMRLKYLFNCLLFMPSMRFEDKNISFVYAKMLKLFTHTERNLSLFHRIIIVLLEQNSRHVMLIRPFNEAANPSSHFDDTSLGLQALPCVLCANSNRFCQITETVHYHVLNVLSALSADCIFRKT